MAEQAILLVEDNPDDVMLALQVLKKHHLVGDVKVAHDGIEALDYLYCEGEYRNRNCANQPDIVLLDLNLPGLSGLEVLKKIRDDQRTELLPVIILTASCETSNIAECYHSGANSYIVKPMDIEEFNNMGTKLIEYWFKANIMPPSSGDKT